MNDLFLVAFLVLATGVACGRVAPAPAPADVTTAADGTTSVDADPDADVTTLADGIDEASDAAVAITDAAVPGNDAPDAEVQAATDAQVQDSPQLELGTPPTTVTWELPEPVGAACLAEVATATSDPRPGQACSQEHELRCTLAGAYQKALSDRTYCVKPYRVRCTATAIGLRWQPETCNLPPTECFHPDYNPPSCQENEKGASCCPLAFVAVKGTSFSGVLGAMCASTSESSSCGGLFSGGRGSCQFLQDPLLQTQLEEAKLAASGLCGTWCKDCKYWYLTEICKPVYQMSCPFSSVPGKSFQVCVSLPGQEDRCAENCQDLIDAGYPWEPWNTQP